MYILNIIRRVCISKAFTAKMITFKFIGMFAFLKNING